MYDIDKVRALNDAFRQTFTGGKVVTTPRITALPAFAELLEKVRTFSNFTEGNDPYKEHDFGALEHAGNQVFWKLDYYNPDLTEGSPDPGDPAVTTRVLTVMLAEEY